MLRLAFSLYVWYVFTPSSKDNWGWQEEKTVAMARRENTPGFGPTSIDPWVPKVKRNTIEFEIRAQQVVWDMHAKETTANKSKDLINGKNLNYLMAPPPPQGVSSTFRFRLKLISNHSMVVRGVYYNPFQGSQGPQEGSKAKILTFWPKNSKWPFSPVFIF